jgi:hypothetical protein
MLRLICQTLETRAFMKVSKLFKALIITLDAQNVSLQLLNKFKVS